ncbi:hypothetical protein CDAR_75911 [Caerostris darwini]|uniref:Uncharacterized protein n=1 Tax=Caerostris darwini TaxID=1538125 RepID=A0AAV4NX78_9ARAC|nr:hypothetical protein CDAR_75911 [Caerostris darwini]
MVSCILVISSILKNVSVAFSFPKGNVILTDHSPNVEAGIYSSILSLYVPGGEEKKETAFDGKVMTVWRCSNLSPDTFTTWWFYCQTPGLP